MNRFSGKGSLVVAFVLLCSSRGGAMPPAESPLAVLDPADVRIGMRGTAHTVLQGDETDHFEVELLGVVPGVRPKGELILFRALGDSLARTGIVAGMSGSPVYVEDKLLGAIAFAFTFSKEPIGLITPIGEMLDGMERVDEAPAPWMGAPGVLYDSFRESFLSRTNDPESWAALVPATPEGIGARSLVTLSAFGWAQELQPVLEQFAQRTGLPSPTAALGGSASSTPASDLKPGSAVGVRLIDGDASLAAIGTVTYVDGDRFAAFGHPMFQGGPVELPVSSAWIHAIIPSVAASFKMGSAGPIIGTIRQDLRAGVAGIVGQIPPMLPVRIVFRGPFGVQRYDYRLARGLLLEPNLLSWAATNSFLQHGWRVGQATFDADLTVHYNKGVSVSRQDRIASRMPALDITQRLLVAVPMLLANPFEQVVIDSVALEITYLPNLQESTMIDLWADKERVRAGELLALTVRLQDHHGETRDVEVEIRAPERARGRDVLILAGSASSMTEWDRERAPALYAPKDLEGLVRLIGEFPSDGDLLVRLYGEQEGVLLGDRELGPLPESVKQVLGARHKHGPAASSASYQIEERRIDVGGTIVGGAAVRVHVE